MNLKRKAARLNCFSINENKKFKPVVNKTPAYIYDAAKDVSIDDIPSYVKTSLV